MFSRMIISLAIASLKFANVFYIFALPSLWIFLIYLKLKLWEHIISHKASSGTFIFTRCTTVVFLHNRTTITKIRSLSLLSFCVFLLFLLCEYSSLLLSAFPEGNENARIFYVVQKLIFNYYPASILLTMPTIDNCFCVGMIAYLKFSHSINNRHLSDDKCLLEKHLNRSNTTTILLYLHTCLPDKN